MKKLLSFLCIVMLTFLTAFAATCDKNNGGEQQSSLSSSSEAEEVLSNVTLANYHVTLYQGKTYQMQATIDESLTGVLVFWSVNDTSIATIDDNGLITASTQNTGTTIGYVQCGLERLPFEITVLPYVPENSYFAAFAKTEFNLNVNGEINLSDGLRVTLGEQEISDYSITATVVSDETAVSLTDGVLKGLKTTESAVSVLLTVSSTVDGVAYSAQQLITVNVY